MRFFEDSAIKRGTPFFVLQGTGGAADQCALVLSHMKWRKVRLASFLGTRPRSSVRLQSVEWQRGLHFTERRQPKVCTMRYQELM